MAGSRIEEPLGYVLLGVFFSLWLSGIISFQTLNFYTNYPNERKWLRTFVGLLVVVDGVQTIIGVAIIWDILVKHFNYTNVTEESIRLFQIYPVLVALISGSVQIFFAWRIRVLSANLKVFAVILVLAIPQFVGGIAYTILTMKVGHLEDFWSFNSVIIGWIASSIVCDIVITATLTMILRGHRANRNLGAAADLVHRVKMMGIHNGLVTILWSLALLIALAAAQRGAHYMFFYPLGKVYLVTMLASLNSRPIVRPDLDPVIQSVLQRSASPRPSARHSLDSFRNSSEHGEKFGRNIPRVSNHMRSASRVVEYLPSTQEEDEDPSRGQRMGFPSHRPPDEEQPLVQESQPQQSIGSPPRNSTSVSSRPRGPRHPTSPGTSGRNISPQNLAGGRL